ncbi:DUF4055 domain-containing protein [Herbaspirillum sp. YR522]|uniref:DUF4055 domain-containing protein n=1 Tax=Herbaspirillum sp. YR522 TaxID=1144342 RepID=UPI00026FB352|nr:DUF4055 domain-containing protein [Herbaspirillum sp. YR522]EJN07799.1 hypothetical protein PMI40_01695 [Herbaspirillum sp. YR522]
MSVKYQHPDYVAMAPLWKRCRDAAAGQSAVHAAREEYLPRLKDQDDKAYTAYVMRTPFYGATWRSMAAMLGLLFRKPPTITAPDAAKDLLADVTLSGSPLEVLAKTLSEEAITVGRVGLFADYPEAAPGTTLADAQRQKLRPSLAMYCAESIINWRFAKVDNTYQLTLVVLVEQRLDRVDEFEDKAVTQYRVLDLESATDGSHHYRVRVFEVQKDPNTGIERDVQIGPTVYPTMGGKSLTSIPFWVMGVDDLTPTCDLPPLIDLVDMNYSHYLTSADYEHGCHFAGLPTPVVSGYAPINGPNGEPPEKLYIGSATAWLFPNPDAKASYLEFTGQGLDALEKNLTRKENLLAILGARMLEAQKKAAEAAETAGLHRAGENSVLASTAQTLSTGIQKALVVFCEWAGITGEVVFSLNRDFFPMPMTPEQLTALVQALQGGAISFETFFAQLQAGEVIVSTRTAEEEDAARKKDTPEPSKTPEAVE